MWWAKNALRSCCGCPEGWDKVQKLLSKNGGSVDLTVSLATWITQVWSNSKEAQPLCPHSFSFSTQPLTSSSYPCWKFLKEFLLKKMPDLLFCLSTHFSIWFWLVVACFPNQTAFLSPLRTIPNAELQTLSFTSFQAQYGLKQRSSVHRICRRFKMSLWGNTHNIIEA